MLEELYKSHGIHSKEYRQSERRHELLELQKKRRNEFLDECRNIEPLKKIFRKPYQSKHMISLKNRIMLSEWLKEIPDDFEKWYIKPCPKGTRVLVIAVDGTTQIFNKHGAFMRKMRSNLPGGRQNKREALTILDCIYVADLDEYFVLDALAYGNQSLTDCDAEFRFFWIESQMRESNLDQHTFRIIENFKCDDEKAINDLFAKYPIWPNNQPELDGFLFYHREASYVPGSTPLVGWLLPFMLPEFFNVPNLNQNYLTEKPDDYTDCLIFMEQFDKKHIEKQKSSKIERNKHKKRIEINRSNENDVESVVREAMELETDHINDDEFINDFEIIDQ